MEAFNPLYILLLLLMNHPLSIPASLSTSPQPSPLPPPPPRLIPKSPLRPSIAVVVGVITTMFSITFLLLLYAKHCRRRVGGTGLYSGGGAGGNGFSFRVADHERKNSGIDRTIIESLPVFRFGSLSGQKDGLECAVCLNQFDPVEVLRLLPKCKHAFHVECVDTWLDAHSTCPLCRYRVDPEDILLLDDGKIQQHEQIQVPEVVPEEVEISVRRVSGRHSSAGERGTGCLQISVDSVAAAAGGSHRRSLDIPGKKKKKREEAAAATPVAVAAAAGVGCMDRHRKDGLLLAEATEEERRSVDRRLEHRIIIGRAQHRWSDVQPSELLYLRSEMIISDSRRFSNVTTGSSRPSITRYQYNNNNVIANNSKDGINDGNNGWWWRQKRRQRRWWWRNNNDAINTRSVSEITGLSRFRGSNEEQEEVAGAVESRWLAWRSTQTQPAVVAGSGRPSTASSSVA